MIPFQQNWHDISPVLQGLSELRASNIPDVHQENHSCITATFVTRMAARSGQSFILESPSSLGASWSRTWLNMAFVIKTMRLLGWLQGSLKSESSICRNGLCWPTHSGGLRSLMCNYATKITMLLRLPTTLQATFSPTNTPTLSLSTLSPTLLHMFSPWMLESSIVWRPIIEKHFVPVWLIWIKQESWTFMRSTCLRLC